MSSTKSMETHESWSSKPIKTNIMSLIIVIIMFLTRESEAARVFSIINDCKETIWAAAIPGDSFDGGGFELKAGQSRVFKAPVGWSGRIWGRTGCNFDKKTNNGSCTTGSCGTSLKCSAAGKPPATLAEFTLANPDFYDVSLVDGFNVPMAVKPINGNGGGNCSVAGCDQDVRDNCPKELSVKDGKTVIGCRSACDVFNTDEYCCRGRFGGPSVCHPTRYSKLFKQACPTSYSYAYDDPTSIFTCSATDYLITFCSNRSKRSCTYHNNKLVCSGSMGVNSLLNDGWSPLIALVFLVTLWTNI
ncbi:Pathogenesis-related protein 5 [Bienertia sinuspersici]